MEGAALIEAKFTGNSVLVPFKGQRRLTIHSLDEVIIVFVCLFVCVCVCLCMCVCVHASV
jgi:hypothetical protein